MVDAPKKIWIDRDHGKHPDDWSFDSDKSLFSKRTLELEKVEYTRSDLVAELSAENERLREENMAMEMAHAAGAVLASTGAVNVSAIRAELRRLESFGDLAVWETYDDRGLTIDEYVELFTQVISAIEPTPPEGQQEPVAREDREDDMSAAILNSHPTRSKSYSTYERAMELVSNRHSKGALVMLVNHLLIQAETRPSEQAVTEAMERFERIADIIERNLWRQDEKVEDAKHIAIQGAVALKAAMEAGG